MARRLALIIGNSIYEDKGLAQLVTPRVDVDSLAEVLRTPEIGGFEEVTSLVDANGNQVRRAISRLSKDKQREDLLLFYFSGHGVLDEQGKLYLAVRDSERDLLTATAIPADFITSEMNRSRSRRQLLILDCCHSGAVGRGMKGAPGETVHTHDAFGATGCGRVVVTATDATQYAWEGDRITGEPQSSVFTHFLIRGLRTGEADREPDGLITIEELFDYVETKVTEHTPRQTPRKFVYDQGGGKFIVARNPSPMPKPDKPPPSRPRRELVASWDADKLESHYKIVSEVLTGHDATIFLGPEASLCGRPEGVKWKLGNLECVPSRRDLATYLAAKANPPENIPLELPQISQYFSDIYERGFLEDMLCKALNADYVPPLLHRFVAKLAAIRSAVHRAGGSPESSGLVVFTSDYDDALERAFEESDQKFKVLTFTDTGEFKILPRLSEGGDVLVDVNPRDHGFFHRDHSFIVKMAGGINRACPERSHYLITVEDQYENLGGVGAIKRFLSPVLEWAVMRRQTLFLGCGQSHWDRVGFVERVSAGQKLRLRRWATQIEPDLQDARFWERRDVMFVPVGLDEYIRNLDERLANLPGADLLSKPSKD